MMLLSVQSTSVRQELGTAKRTPVYSYRIFQDTSVSENVNVLIPY